MQVLTYSQVMERLTINPVHLDHAISSPWDLLLNLREFVPGSECAFVSAIITVDYTGFATDFDPKTVLASITDSTLASLASAAWVVSESDVGTLPSTRFFCLEYMRREGAIRDWSFTRTSQLDGNICYQLAEPIVTTVESPLAKVMAADADFVRMTAIGEAQAARGECTPLSEIKRKLGDD